MPTHYVGNLTRFCFPPSDSSDYIVLHLNEIVNFCEPVDDLSICQAKGPVFCTLQDCKERAVRRKVECGILPPGADRLKDYLRFLTTDTPSFEDLTPADCQQQRQRCGVRVAPVSPSLTAALTRRRLPADCTPPTPPSRPSPPTRTTRPRPLRPTASTTASAAACARSAAPAPSTQASRDRPPPDPPPTNRFSIWPC